MKAKWIFLALLLCALGGSSTGCSGYAFVPDLGMRAKGAPVDTTADENEVPDPGPGYTVVADDGAPTRTFRGVGAP